jgi:hypothetical protein
LEARHSENANFGHFCRFLLFPYWAAIFSPCHRGIEGMFIEGATLPQQMHMRLPVCPAGHRFG